MKRGENEVLLRLNIQWLKDKKIFSLIFNGDKNEERGNVLVMVLKEGNCYTYPQHSTGRYVNCVF